MVRAVWCELDVRAAMTLPVSLWSNREGRILDKDDPVSVACGQNRSWSVSQ